MKDKHCLYMGQEDTIRLCCYPGMAGVDAHCIGYDKCAEYEKGGRDHIDKPKITIKNIEELMKFLKEY